MAEGNRYLLTGHVWVAMVNLFVALAGVVVMLWLFVEDRAGRDEAARLERQRASCERVVSRPQASPVPEQAPPQDAPKDGYFGTQGSDVRPIFRLNVEAIRAGQPPEKLPEQLLLGSQALLPAGKIHVVNLWATWCTPCLDEMPAFQKLFATHQDDWTADVRFVPILVKDPTEPRKAYEEIEQFMPSAPFRLADRGLKDPLTSALAADPEQALFRGKLPVTLVLDCNRRVRWAHFAQLLNSDLRDLERIVDDLRSELEDTRPDAWCQREWAGNGRCEGREATPGGHVLEDCGKLTPAVPDIPVEVGDSAGETPPPPVKPCPPDTEPIPGGGCKRKLRGNPPPIKKAPKAVCGDGQCNSEETPETCCDDCKCEAWQKCMSVGDVRACRTKLKMKM